MAWLRTRGQRASSLLPIAVLLYPDKPHIPTLSAAVGLPVDKGGFLGNYSNILNPFSCPPAAIEEKPRPTVPSQGDTIELA